MNDPQLAEALLQAIRAQDFAATPDALQGGKPLGLHPNIDLALVLFRGAEGPRWANVLFSREHPQGFVAQTEAQAGPVNNVRFERDVQGANGDSIAWLPGADWARMDFPPLHGQGTRFIAPYPASLLKLMVAVGLGLAMDAGTLHEWPADLEPMIVVSDNDATTRCIALLHRRGGVEALNRRLAEWRLPTLQLNDTTREGGWRNGDGSGVGHIHMTAWDTARLLWLLDPAAPPAPWLPAGSALLRPATRAHLYGVLQRQQLDEILSSGALRGLPGWVSGLPDAPAFAHKTGNTQNYAADAGILRTGRCHGIVALLTTLGQRYAPHEKAATTWRLPALGAALHRLMEDFKP